MQGLLYPQCLPPCPPTGAPSHPLQRVGQQSKDYVAHNAPRAPACPDSFPHSTAPSSNGARTPLPTVLLWARPQRAEPVAREEWFGAFVVRICQSCLEGLQPLPAALPAPAVLLPARPAALRVSADAGRGVPPRASIPWPVPEPGFVFGLGHCSPST